MGQTRGCGVGLTTRLVTIGIPAFNRFHYLQEAVASGLGQTYPNVEVLISDNGDDRAIRAWCEALAEREPRVRYRRNSTNLGMAGNFNAIADAARGEYLVIICDDDRLLPGFVARAVSAMEPGTRVVFSNHYVIDSRGRRLEAMSQRWTSFYHRDRLAAGPVANPEICAWSMSVPMTAAMLRTADANRLRFKDDLNTPEVELFIRLAQQRGAFVFMPEYLAEYRVHPGSATRAGLWTDRLVSYLLRIPVLADVEPYKQRLLRAIMIDAVGSSLARGDTGTARDFRKNPYYSHHGSAVTYLMQALAVMLPPSWGGRLYRIFLRSRSTLRRT